MPAVETLIAGMSHFVFPKMWSCLPKAGTSGALSDKAIDDRQGHPRAYPTSSVWSVTSRALQSHRLQTWSLAENLWYFMWFFMLLLNTCLERPILFYSNVFPRESNIYSSNDIAGKNATRTSITKPFPPDTFTRPLNQFSEKTA